MEQTYEQDIIKKYESYINHKKNLIKSRYKLLISELLKEQETEIQLLISYELDKFNVEQQSWYDYILSFFF